MTGDVPFSDGEECLVDILDRVLDVGLVVAGDLSISVADVDLVRVGVRLAVASSDKFDTTPGLASAGLPKTNHATQAAGVTAR